MTEIEKDCTNCDAFTFMEIVTIADSLVEDSYNNSGALRVKEDIIRERKLHYIATVAENAVSKLRVEGKLCRQCPWYEK